MQDETDSAATAGDTDLDEASDKGSFMDLVTDLKWYFVPVRLHSLPKERIGAEFIQDPVQQLALQKGIEVWIDSELYEQGSDQAKAKLLLHEIVIYLYLAKFIPFDELFQRHNYKSYGNDIDFHPDLPQDARERFQKLAEQLTQPVPYRELNEEDYRNVRGMTDWLFSINEKTKYEELYQNFYRFNFDKRLFSLPTSVDEESRTEHSNLWDLISGEEILDFVKDQSLLQRLPGQGSGGRVLPQACMIEDKGLLSEHPIYKQNKDVFCSFRILEERTSQVDGITAVKIEFSVLSGGQLLKSWEFWIKKSVFRVRTGERWANPQRKNTLVTALSFAPAVIGSLSPGDTLGQLHLEFEGSPDQKRLVQIYATGLKVLSIDPDSENPGNLIFRAGSPKHFESLTPTGFFDPQRVLPFESVDRMTYERYNFEATYKPGFQ